MLVLVGHAGLPKRPEPGVAAPVRTGRINMLRLRWQLKQCSHSTQLTSQSAASSLPALDSLPVAHAIQLLACTRARWVSMLLLEWLWNEV